MVVTLSTFNDLTVDAVTEKINGKLLALIIDSNTQIQIRIKLADYPGITLFNKVDCRGENYFPLRVLAKDFRGDIFNYSQEHWYLNDKLKIEVDGVRNTEVKVVIRYG